MTSTCFIINHDRDQVRRVYFGIVFRGTPCISILAWICGYVSEIHMVRSFDGTRMFLSFFFIVVFLYPLLIYIPFYRAPGTLLPASLTPFVFFSLFRVWFFGYVHVDFCRSWRKDANTALQAWFQRHCGFILFYTIDRSRGKFQHIFHLSRKNKWEIMFHGGNFCKINRNSILIIRL